MSFGLPASPDTELDAVNVVLKAKGLEPATSVDLSDGEVADAVFHLDATDLEIQSKGWYFNKDFSLALTLASDNTVPLPAGTLSVANAYYYQRWPLIAERAGKLYNLSDKSFTFSTAPVVDIVVRLAWVDLPPVARRYIATLAAHRAQGLDQSNSTVIQVTNQMVQQALVPLEWEQDKAQPANQVHQNLTLIGSLRGFGGMVRNRVV